MEHCLCEEPDLPGGVKLLYIAGATVCVIMAGLVSGLTLGLMSIDSVDLEVLKRSGTEKEKHYASKIEPLVARPHLLLVTLLVCNALCAEALPIFLDRLLNPITAIIISVTVVLVFGEIVPQALCTRYGLAIGAHAAWLVRVLIFLFYIIAKPISMLLDYLLGHGQAALFRRPQLKALVDIQAESTNITDQEAHIIAGTLDLASKTAKYAMTPLDKVFSIADDAVLDEDTLQCVLDSGHSRVPVHRRGNKQHFIGLLLVKELVLLDPEDCVPVMKTNLRPVPYVDANLAMFDLLTLFATGRSHMVALVDKAPPEEGGEVPDSDAVTESQMEAALAAINAGPLPTQTTGGSYQPPALVPPIETSAVTVNGQEALAGPQGGPQGAPHGTSVSPRRSPRSSRGALEGPNRAPRVPSLSPPRGPSSYYRQSSHDVEGVTVPLLGDKGYSSDADVTARRNPSGTASTSHPTGGPAGAPAGARRGRQVLFDRQGSASRGQLMGMSSQDIDGSIHGMRRRAAFKSQPSLVQVAGGSASPITSRLRIVENAREGEEDSEQSFTAAAKPFTAGRSPERSAERLIDSATAAAGTAGAAQPTTAQPAAAHSVPPQSTAAGQNATAGASAGVSAGVGLNTVGFCEPSGEHATVGKSSSALHISRSASEELAVDERRLYKSKTMMMAAKAKQGHLEGLRTVGIITLEDLIEELLGYEILDETDIYVDNLRTERVVLNDIMRKLPPHLRKILDERQLYPVLHKVASNLPGNKAPLAAVKVDKP